MTSLRIITRSAALLGVSLTLASPAGGQKDRNKQPADTGQLTFNWATGGLIGRTPRAGQSVSILVNGLNPLCYAYTGKAEPVKDTPDLASFLGAISEASPASDNPKATGARTAVADTGRLAPATALSARLQAWMDLIAADIEVAKDPCRREAEVQQLLNHWPELGQTVDSANATAAAIRKALAGVLNPDSAERAEMARITGVLSAWDTARVAARPHLSAIATAAARRVLYLRPANGVDTRAFLLTVTATKHQRVDGEAPETKTVSIPVSGAVRVFVSTGMVVTRMAAKSFRRVNRPYAIKDTAGLITGYADSSFSTYGAQDASAFDHFSPAVQLNASIPAIADAFMASFGVAARTVNKATRPEPFAGFSLTAADRFVVSAGVHWTRVEELRVVAPGETAADVERRRVPSSITDADAIGTRGAASLYLSFTVKP